MPPEPFPWDRKDLFRDRKHQSGYDRVSEPFGGSVSRWRDSPSHGSRNEFGRLAFPSDFRRPPGHGKQGGWLYPEDFSHGYSTARSGDRYYQENGSYRPSGPYRDGRYNRNFRENRGSFNQKDWRGHSWDCNHHYSIVPGGPSRPHEGKGQRLIDGPPARISYPYSEEASTSSRARSKEQPDEHRGVNDAGIGPKIEKDNSLASVDWKPFKWPCSGSLPSRGSGFSLSSSSKSAGESCDVKIELPLKIATPDESFSGDLVGCLASPTSVDDTAFRKKARLGWGQGLAKYEKKVVDGPDECQMKNSSTLCTGSIESMHSPAQCMAATNQMTGSLLECRSPVTPSSAACTSSPGLDDKSYMKAAEVDSDANNLTPSPGPRSQDQSEELPLSPEIIELHSVIDHGLRNELVENVDQSLVDSESIKYPGVNKLLLFKGEILKALELTESEIDSLENELKLLKSQHGSNYQCPESSSSISLDCKEKPGAMLNLNQRPPSLRIVSLGESVKEDMVPCGNIIEDVRDVGKNEYEDSPGTATSKFKEPLPSDKFATSDQQKHGFPGESIRYEVCTSVELQKVAGSSAPNTDSKLAKDGNIPGHDILFPSNHFEESEVHNIFASNKKTATEASNYRSNLLPCSSCVKQNTEATSASCTPSDLIKEKFLKRQHSLRFKERAICMKYRVFQYLWKEDLQLLCERKYRVKSQKKVESSYRYLHGGSQKQRPSIRIRVASPACKSSLFPKSEVVSYTGKLLLDPQIRSCRNGLKMPSLILDKKDNSMFLSNNGLVEDPCALEKERALMNPWTDEEKEIFLDKYTTLGKDFKRISSFLDHKTTADCIEFYYKNQKSNLFKKTKQHEIKKQKSALNTRYLMTSGKKLSKEMNAAASLDMLGTASAIVSNDAKPVKSISSRKVRLNGNVRDMSSSYEIEDERETEAADVLASICGSLSSETTSSYITSSADPEGKSQRHPDLEEDDTCSDESCGCYADPVDWTDEEKSSFVQALSSFGKDFVMISRCVQTKSRDQCRVFFGKARKCLGLEMLCRGRGKGAGGGRSDTEDACVVEDGEEKKLITNMNDRVENDKCLPVESHPSGLSAPTELVARIL